MDKPAGRVVMIESPYRESDRGANLRYLAWCELDSFRRGEFPISSHGNCTAYLPEDETGRERGFEWRNRIRWFCDEVVYYTDLTFTEGMRLAQEEDRKSKVCTSYRVLPPELMGLFRSGLYPSSSMRRIALET